MPDVEAGREAIRRFRAAIAAGASVSLESTLTGNTVLARMRAARHAGYTVSLFYVALATSEDNIARVAARVANGGHDIPEAVIRRRVAASQDNLPAALAIAHFAKVHDNSNREIEKLLEVAHHRIVFEVPDPPEWLATRLAAIRAALAALA